jgi:hypothetical protein
MKTPRRIGSLLVTVSIAVGGLLTVSTPAQAVFHNMKVREVDAGTAAAPDADFVELRCGRPVRT